jgi:hypothetical protein
MEEIVEQQGSGSGHPPGSACGLSNILLLADSRQQHRLLTPNRKIALQSKSLTVPGKINPTATAALTNFVHAIFFDISETNVGGGPWRVVCIHRRKTRELLLAAVSKRAKMAAECGFW